MVSISWAVALFSLALGVVAKDQPAAPTSLPIVDLGYERHQAISFNETGAFYNFSNIRFAEPPVGNLRFRAPVAVTGKSSVVNNGSVGVICPQSDPAWLAIADEFIPAFLAGIPFNLTAAEAALAASSTGQIPAQDPRTTEDCLFLDVFVPQKIFESSVSGSNSGSGGKGKRDDDNNSSGGAPVLVWIYGGGYTGGEKTGDGQFDPAGLIKASQVSGSEGIIFVALNYRLGAFGWLSGPTFQQDGTANAGLYDQRLGLEWVQNNIHLFGGDKTRVTVMGESAGAGSIVHQITAFGGFGGPVPFAQAIPQSPAWQSMPSSFQQEEVFQGFLEILNVSSIAEARTLPSSALILANILQVGGSAYGQFTYGPVVDGLFTPATPGRLLQQGSFHKNLKVMVGHNSDEGLLFTSPGVTNDSAFAAFIQQANPDISPTILNFLTTELYPPVFDGSQPYTSQIERAILALSDSSFTCNTNYLDRAFGNKTFAYEFSVFPGLHGEDISFTFANGPNIGPGASLPFFNSAIATALQEYITSFVINGAPSGPGIPQFPLYGNSSEILNLNVTISEMMDDTANARCLWWQKALYY